MLSLGDALADKCAPSSGSSSEVTEITVVLLGASNLARSLPWALAAARQIFADRPLEVLAALGHGRSYGVRSQVLLRALPGILECGLWAALNDRPQRPTYAFLADIGNDLAYGFAPETILSWIETCCRRLQWRGAHDIRLMTLPMSTLMDLRPWQMSLLRAVMFPSSRVDPTEVYPRLAALDRRMRHLAANRRMTLVEQDPTWYGVDPIHFRRRFFSAFWHRVLAPWAGEEARSEAPVAAAGSILERWAIETRCPERRWLCGFEQRRQQPAWSSPGLRLSLF